MAYLVPILGFIAIILLIVIIKLLPISDYINCNHAHHANISMRQIIAMKFRKTDVSYLLEKFVTAQNAGLTLTMRQLETHMLSNGNIDSVINGLISARTSHIPLDFDRAAAIDLAGRDVSQAVRMCVQPRVINLNNICGIAKDGIELKVKASLTIKANLDTMVGGAGEDTITARVSERIVSTIGSAKKHGDILNQPSILSKEVLASGLDANTAFEIISLDIADIDVGRNIGAYLLQYKAAAEKRVAEAKAEGRRAMAKAQMQENKAAEQEAKANLIKAEMEVPLTLANAYRTGQLLSKKKQAALKQQQLQNQQLQIAQARQAQLLAARQAQLQQQRVQLSRQAAQQKTVTQTAPLPVSQPTKPTTNS